MRRYNIETSIGEDYEPVESSDGEYVLYADHAESIAELQQIIDSYNAFCKGVGAHVVLAQQDAEIRRLRAEVERLRAIAAV